jgi:aryl-alcohol dehydrogenase-like predicted oxidoreductase
MAGIPRTRLTPHYEISRVIKGGWQLAGDHGPIDPKTVDRDMAAFVEAGITTFDCADIYTGVEAMIGAFRARHPTLACRTQVHTKFVPDLTQLNRFDDAYVERIVDRSLQRLHTDRLDLVQFHWWDYAVPRYIEAAMALERLRVKGKIAHIGVTNFDVPHLMELLDAGVPVVAHQLQYSLLDSRALNGMVQACQARGIGLLCYGTVAGGFLSDRWLGKPAPSGDFANRGLTKYKLIIDDFGGWELFQELLRALRAVADRYSCDIATVASRVMLQRDAVSAVIVGATNASHLDANARIGAAELDSADLAAIDTVTCRHLGPEGDVFTLERDRHGRHGRIMKYDLNER